MAPLHHLWMTHNGGPTTSFAWVWFFHVKCLSAPIVLSQCTHEHTHCNALVLVHVVQKCIKIGFFYIFNTSLMCLCMLFMDVISLILTADLSFYTTMFWGKALFVPCHGKNIKWKRGNKAWQALCFTIQTGLRELLGWPASGYIIHI